MNPIRGIGFKILSVIVFMAMATCIKSVAPEIPPGEAVFFRSFFALPLIFGWLALRHDAGGGPRQGLSQGIRTGLRTANPAGHLWRGLVGSAAMGLSFLALGLLPLPEAVAIGYTAPLLATIFAAMFLGEVVRIYRMSAIALGFVGVLIVLSPRLTLVDPETASKLETVGAFAALMGAVFAALAQVFVRKLVQQEQTSAIVAYFSITAALLSLLTIPLGWATPTPTQAALLVAAGLLGGLGQILLTESYRNADAGVVAPFDYLSMLLAIAVGYVVFEEIPTSTMMLGAALVAAAGLFIIWRERQLGLERARARRVMTPQG